MIGEKMHARLGVNIDHVATLREVRHAVYPSVINAADAAIRGGADGITIHLREDRRHIQDHDVVSLKESINVPMNLEVACSDEMIDLALKYSPEHVCLVPERREELTTEGGLNLFHNDKYLQKQIDRLKNAGIQVSLFIEADKKQIEKAADLQADVIEIHTGKYAEPAHQAAELEKTIIAAKFATDLGIEVHAGHGLTLDNLEPLLNIKEIKEFNIGHAIVAHAVFVGLEQAVRDYKNFILQVNNKEAE